MSLTVHFALVLLHFHCCDCHGHGLWPSWSWIVAVMVIDCGRHGHGLWPSWSWIVAVMVMDCGRHGIGPVK